MSRLKRRRFLVAAGLTATIAGCTGSGDDDNGDDDGTDDNGDEDNGEENGVDDGDDDNGDDDNGDDVDIDAPHPTDDDHGYETVTYDDVDVPIVPLEDTLEWYEAELVAFLDARGSEESHENARIPGAVWSEYPDEIDDDDPINDWESDDPIVVYSNDQSEESLCVLKAVELIGDGYEYVYVMEAGFTEWRERDYPMEGLGPDGELEGGDDEE